jgi:hypothetical protein
VRDVDARWKRQREHHPKYKSKTDVLSDRCSTHIASIFSARPCRDWLLGTCRRGASCSYLHPPRSSSTAQAPQSPIELSPVQPFATMPGFSQSSYGYYPSIPGPPVAQAMPLYDVYADEPESATTTGESDSSSVSPSTPSEPPSALDDGPWDPQSSAKFAPMMPSGMPLTSPLYAHHHQFFLPQQQSPPPMVVHVPVHMPLPPTYIPFYPSRVEAASKGRPRSVSQPPVHRRKAPTYKSRSPLFITLLVSILNMQPSMQPSLANTSIRLTAVRRVINATCESSHYWLVDLRRLKNMA